MLVGDGAQERADAPGTYTVDDGPVMKSAVSAAEILKSGGRIRLWAEGGSIPNAVAVANILTEVMLRDRARLGGIAVDSTEPPGMGRMTSNIEIVLEIT